MRPDAQKSVFIVLILLNGSSCQARLQVEGSFASTRRRFLELELCYVSRILLLYHLTLSSLFFNLDVANDNDSDSDSDSDDNNTVQTVCLSLMKTALWGTQHQSCPAESTWKSHR